MGRPQWWLFASFVLAAVGGCSGGDSGPEVDAEGFEVITQLDWSLDPGGEEYLCLRRTFDEEIYMGAFEAIAPTGTHHTILTIGWPDGPAGGPDGVAECGSFEHHFDAFVFQSATEASNRWVLPDGVAARILPGQQAIMNVHIINSSDDPMSGTTKVKMKRVDESEVEHVGAATFMGPTLLEIPPGTESTQVGGCELSSDVKLVGVSPHMHDFGRHMKVVAHSSIVGETVVIDQDFKFEDHQYYSLIEPEIPMAEGDLLEVSCTYDNSTGDWLYWGYDYWTAEMCWAAMFLYPAETQTSACSS